MNSRNSLLIKAGVVLVILWAAVWGIMKVAGGMKASPEKVVALVESRPLDGLEDPEERKKVIGNLAKMLNELDGNEVGELFEDRRESGNRDDWFFSDMSEEEQWYFMELRMGRAFDQMMTSFNDMDPDERKRIVQRTLKDMERGGENGDARDRMRDRDPEMVDKIVNEGLRSYYQKASAETKLDLAPLMEEMQRNVGLGRGMRGGPRED